MLIYCYYFSAISLRKVLFLQAFFSLVITSVVVNLNAFSMFKYPFKKAFKHKIHIVVNYTTNYLSTHVAAALRQHKCLAKLHPGESCAGVLLPGVLIHTWVHFIVSAYWSASPNM